MAEQKSLTYVEIDVPHCSLTYGVAPCTASLTNSPPTGTIKCFNSLGTCQDRINFTDVPVTLRFAIDTIDLPKDIEAFPFIKSVDFTAAIISLGGDLGQRATLKVTFRDAQHSDAGDTFDKYSATRTYSDPFNRGTFWGKFRARNPFLRGRSIRLIRGLLGQTLAEMETRYYVIESYDGPTPQGEFTIIGKDVLKLADSDRAQAPALSNGFLVAAIGTGDVTATLSPSGIGDTEYPETGYAVIGGKEIVSFTRFSESSLTKFLLHFPGADASTTITEGSFYARTWTPAGNAQIDTAASKFGGSSLLLDGTGDYITTPSSTDFDPGSGPFKIGGFFRRNATGVMSLCGQGDGSAAGDSIFVTFSAANVIVFQVSTGSGYTPVTGTTAITADGLFHHFEAGRSGNVLRLFVDGVQEGGNVAFTGSVPASTNDWTIGREGSVALATFNGWVDDIRLRMEAVPSANFTPPTSAYGQDILHVTTGDVLTITRAQLNTEASTHDISDRVQLMLRYVGEDGADIISDLLQTYAGVVASYIPLASWQAETAAFLGRVYTYNIAVPTSVNQLVSELLEQMGGALWWDDANQIIRLQILRAVSTAADRYNEDNVMEGSLEVKEQPEKRVSRVTIYFGQINPLKRVDDLENYRSSEQAVDEQSETDEGTAAIKTIFARGVAAGGRTVATRMGELHLSRYVRPPRRLNFDLFRYAGQNPLLGSGYRLGGGSPFIPSWPFQDETGARADLPIQLTRLDPDADRYKVEAEEMLFTAFGGDIDPTQRTIIFDANENNINLRTRHDELYPEPVSGDQITAIVNAGVIIGSTSTALRALDVGSWPAGVTINLQLIGRIQGSGGKGGNAPTSGTGSPGLPGGVALYTRFAINLDVDEGEIFGGGGGGGSGSATPTGAGGGGGGAGQLPGLGGAGVAPTPSPGANGTTEAGGAGGDDATDGGAGGGPGLAGSTGTGIGGVGGVAGVAIDGISFVIVTQGPGDIRGSQVN